MGDGGFDPCECIWSHEFAMRRLISLLRNSQSYCTDAECFQEMPGPLPQDTTSIGGFNFLLFTLAWMVIAMALYFMRPKITRNGEDQKPHRNSGPQDGPPPPPPNMALQWIMERTLMFSKMCKWKISVIHWIDGFIYLKNVVYSFILFWIIELHCIGFLNSTKF